MKKIFEFFKSNPEFISGIVIIFTIISMATAIIYVIHAMDTADENYRKRVNYAHNVAFEEFKKDFYNKDFYVIRTHNRKNMWGNSYEYYATSYEITSNGVKFNNGSVLISDSYIIEKISSEEYYINYGHKDQKYRDIYIKTFNSKIK